MERWLARKGSLLTLGAQRRSFGGGPCSADDANVAGRSERLNSFAAVLEAAISPSDADLLMAATASLHGERLPIFDAGLAENLRAGGFDNVTLLARE